MPVNQKRKYSAYAIGKMYSTARKFRRTGSAVGSQRKVPARTRFSRSKASSLKRALSMHSYSRYATTPSNYNLSGTELDVAETFTFDSISAYSEFSSLYDRYRITAVQMNITLINNPDAFLYTNGAVNNQNQTNWYPKLWYVKDYDDSSTNTLAALRERSGVKCVILRPNKVYKITVRPAILNQTYRTSTTTGYAPKWKEWIDMANANVPHYGLKWVVDTQDLDPDDQHPFKVRVEYKYFFTCKDVL